MCMWTYVCWCVCVLVRMYTCVRVFVGLGWHRKKDNLQKNDGLIVTFSYTQNASSCNDSSWICSVLQCVVAWCCVVLQSAAVCPICSNNISTTNTFTQNASSCRQHICWKIFRYRVLLTTVDSFSICWTWLIHIGHESFMCDTWLTQHQKRVGPLINVSDSIRASWLIYMCDMICHTYSFTCVTWLVTHTKKIV